jgi:transcriptional regulator with XRE-family HTH domain
MNNTIHIGSYLSRLIAIKKLKRSEITSMMGVQYSAFYGYENRHSLQFSILMRLCHAMKYNIFLDIANTFPAHYEYDAAKTSERDNLLAQLQEENKKLKWENELLKDMMIKKG